VSQVLAMLPSSERAIGGLRFAEALSAVVAQQLVPRKSGEGRVPVVESLIATPEVRQAIRDGERIEDLRDLMAKGSAKSGMQTFAQHANHLAKEGSITAETAKAASGEPETQGKGRR